jgi:hypothetical protein
VSTILKALRRLESERATPTDGRPLREAVAAAEPLSRPPQGRRWAPLASMLIGVAVGATALLLWPRGEPSPAATPEARVSALAAAPPASGAAQPSPAPRNAARAREARAPSPAGPPPEAFASDVAVVPRPAPSPRLVDSQATETALAAGAPEASAARSGAGDLPEPAPPAPAVRIAGPPAVVPAPPVAEPKPRTRGDGTSAAPAPGNVARTAAMPAVAPPAPEERAADIIDEPGAPATGTAASSGPEEAASGSGAAPPSGPSRIRVEKTLWHPLAERRVAVVTLPDRDGPMRVREGELLGDVRVSKIEPSGVVFSGDAGEVRRAVGAP